MAITIPDDGVPMEPDHNAKLAQSSPTIVLSTAAQTAEDDWNTAMDAKLASADYGFGKTRFASLTTALTGTNNDVVFTAKDAGAARGNAISVEYVDPGGATATLGVVVDGSAITVNLGRTASAIDTTGDLLKAAIEAEEAADALVSVADAAGNDGSGLVTAMSETTLEGGR